MDDTPYSFMRQPQTFPDVRLKKSLSDDTLLGVELKGWYLLAKEAEPSLRFQVTPAACAKQDLIVVVPWVLGNVISGSPILFEPFVESARFAAEFRNYHWQHIRKTELSTRSTRRLVQSLPIQIRPNQRQAPKRQRRQFRKVGENRHDGRIHV